MHATYGLRVPARTRSVRGSCSAGEDQLDLLFFDRFRAILDHMTLDRWATALLRIALVVLFGILVVFQTLSLPGQFRYLAEQHPEDAALRWPATVITVFWVLCVQVVIVATWRLLTLVRRDRIFTEASLGWVDAIVWAVAAGWLVLVGVLLWVGLHADDPGLPMLLLLATAVVTVVALVLLVLRALLRQATALRTDLDQVI